MSGKLVGEGPRLRVAPAEAERVVARILRGAGCPDETAQEVAAHLVDASLCGMDSHGVMRVLQYEEQFRSGTMDPAVRPIVRATARGGEEVTGQGGIGIPAIRMAVSHACERARVQGVAALPVRDVGHTGRLGAFAEAGARDGFLVIITGGGRRQAWRQVAPHGGRRAVLPTNPWCLASPGGARGPVVADFATGMVAGGWLYAARSAGARLPDGAIIDAEGRPTTDPGDYFAGGAILPRGGPMGTGLAVMSEMLCEAMLGPPSTEVNWLVLTLDTTRHQAPSAMQEAAEAVLAEVRACPPADGFAAVEVPGERERSRRAVALVEGISLPVRTWEQILARDAAIHG